MKNELTSRERIMKALQHEEPDRVPFDLGSTHLTGISMTAYRNLCKYIGISHKNTSFSDVIQQLAMPSDEVLDYFGVDTRGIFPLTSHNHDVEKNMQELDDKFIYHDEWGITHQMKKEQGYWFSIIQTPMESLDPEIKEIEDFNWPVAGDPERIAGLRQKATDYRRKGKPVVIKGLCAGLFEMYQRIRGMENAMMDALMYPDFSERLIGKIADLKIEFWDMALGELHDVADIIVEADDYGTQESQLISPGQFRKDFKPHIKRVLEFIRQKSPDSFIFFHSCGNVRPIIPDFIEMGVDILNPVHINASGMEPVALKKDFGKDITFWGGGVETQNILPKGTTRQVEDDVKRNMDALAPGGGFVFNTIHNIQAEVPPENIVTMWKTMKDYGKY